MNHEANAALNLMPTSDPDDDVSIQGILPIQFQMVGQALRREIHALERTRDDDLRNKIPHQRAPWVFALETQNRCRDKSAALLQRARSQLHKAVDNLMDELDAETSAVHYVPRQQTTPITPLSGTRFHEPAPGPGTERLSQPRAPVAEMDCDIFAGSGYRARSVTMPVHEHPAPVISDLPMAGPSTSGGERPGAAHTPPPPPPPPVTPQSKRPGADPAATSSKRAKTTNTGTPSKTATASKIVTLQTPTKTTPAKGKKADSAKKSASRITATVDLDADEEYRQSQSQSDDDLPPIEDIGRKKAHRAAKGKNVVYMDQPLGENEFVDS
ncbi:hypothetical protein KJ359_004627 [Pestalotiopsis sp. 9143b]|nr:hypothetical protein KJ359_004627 [Pestalotiopsis sp. 9143b]